MGEVMYRRVETVKERSKITQVLVLECFDRGRYVWDIHLTAHQSCRSSEAVGSCVCRRRPSACFEPNETRRTGHQSCCSS
jgi:hypothetical protein